MLELYVLICSILLLLLVVSYKTAEPFETPKTDYNLTSCPSGYTLFYDKNQSTMCCDGEVNGKLCMGSKQCVLAGSSTGESCINAVVDDYKYKSDEFCPSSMPSYYENRIKKTKGCTSGLLNQTMDGPSTVTQAQCKIYDTLNANINALDSCSNQKEMDAFPCFGKNCIKTLSQSVPDSPVLITISFADNNGIQRSVHTRDSMQRFLDATQPNWRDKGMDLSKNIAIAEVAKAVYIDKTMSKDDVQN
jgi:hypothetical protein